MSMCANKDASTAIPLCVNTGHLPACCMHTLLHAHNIAAVSKELVNRLPPWADICRIV